MNALRSDSPEEETPQRESAWEGLYQQHQSILVRFARKRGCDEHEAWDVVQDLFVRVFRMGMIVNLSSWSEELQRAWLLRTLRWRINNQHRDRTRLKRGNSHCHESLNQLLEDGFEIPDNVTPATEYDRRWAVSVLELGLARIREKSKPTDWDHLESGLLGYNSSQTSGARRVASHRARVRLRKFICSESTYTALYIAVSRQN